MFISFIYCYLWSKLITKTETMKTLFERLKPELLDAMYTESKLYPTLMESLREELKSKYSYLQLTVNQGQRLTQLKNQNIGIMELVDCFED